MFTRLRLASLVSWRGAWVSRSQTREGACTHLFFRRGDFPPPRGVAFLAGIFFPPDGGISPHSGKFPPAVGRCASGRHLFFRTGEFPPIRVLAHDVIATPASRVSQQPSQAQPSQAAKPSTQAWRQEGRRPAKRASGWGVPSDQGSCSHSEEPEQRPQGGSGGRKAEGAVRRIRRQAAGGRRRGASRARRGGRARAARARGEVKDLTKGARGDRQRERRAEARKQARANGRGRGRSEESKRLAEAPCLGAGLFITC
jgi:hypothetical protein